MARARVVAVVVAAVVALVPAVARADGDPASDVLLSQSLFLAADAGFPAQREAGLEDALQAAARSGYPIRLAVISTPADLGSITALWRQPESYAQFLGQELSLAYHGRVLVAMPDGFGLYGSSGLLPAERSAVAHDGAPGGGAGLAAAALEAVRRLAAAAGHPLPAATAAGAAGQSAGGSARTTGGGELTAWIVFGLGAAMILAAWTVSLRARPVRLRGRGISSV